MTAGLSYIHVLRDTGINISRISRTTTIRVKIRRHQEESFRLSTIHDQKIFAVSFLLFFYASNEEDPSFRVKKRGMRSHEKL